MPPQRTSTTLSLASRFLDAALKKAGPFSLCYVHVHLKWMIRKHILDLVVYNPTLNPRAHNFTYDDGSTAYLLNISGVLPLKKQRGLRSTAPFPAEIHVEIWLHPRYPIDPPSVTVSLPSAAAQAPLALAHPFVDPSTGAVTTPYLLRWGDPSSRSPNPDLSQLAHNLVEIFTYWPPFTFMITPPRAAPTAAAAPSGQQAPQVSDPDGHSQLVDAIPNTTAAAVTDAQQDNNNTRKKISKFPIGTSSMASPREAVDRLAMALLHDLSLLTTAIQEDIRGLVASQARLRYRAAAYDLIDSTSSEDLDQLHQEVRRVNAHVNDLEQWLELMDESRFPERAPEEVFMPDDDESSWKLEELSGFTAIDDLVHLLDKAVEKKVVPVRSYLQQVRTLAREQAAFVRREAVTTLSREGLP